MRRIATLTAISLLAFTLFAEDKKKDPDEIGNRDVRMKAEHVKTTATTEAVSSHPGETRHWSPKWRRNTSRAGKKPVADCKKDL